jgi:hypothetical protein
MIYKVFLGVLCEGSSCFVRFGGKRIRGKRASGKCRRTLFLTCQRMFYVGEKGERERERERGEREFAKAE